MRGSRLAALIADYIDRNPVLAIEEVTIHVDGRVCTVDRCWASGDTINIGVTPKCLSEPSPSR
jgi:DNA-binding GntR family transcriptional regulator